MIPEILEGCGLLVAARRRGRARRGHRAAPRPSRGGARRSGAGRASAPSSATASRRRGRALPAGRARRGGVARREARHHLPAVFLPRRRRDRDRRSPRRARPARLPDRSRDHARPARRAGRHGAAAPRAEPALRAFGCCPSPLAARAAPSRARATTSSRATSAASARTSIARARGRHRGYLEAMGRVRAEPLPSPRPRARAAHLHAARRRATSWPSRGRDAAEIAATLRHPGGASERRVQRGRPRPLPSGSPRRGSRGPTREALGAVGRATGWCCSWARASSGRGSGPLIEGLARLRDRRAAASWWRARATPRRIGAWPLALGVAERVRWLGPRHRRGAALRDGRRRGPARALRAVRQRAPRGPRVAGCPC